MKRLFQFFCKNGFSIRKPIYITIASLGLITCFFAICGHQKASQKSSQYSVLKFFYEISDEEGEIYRIPCLQVSNCFDVDVQNMANWVLKNSVADILRQNHCDKFRFMETASIDVMLLSDTYLSLLYTISCDEEGIIEYGDIRFGITIDMTTGERVNLSDVANITSKNLYDYEYNSEFSPPVTQEEATIIIRSASMSESDYLIEKKNSGGYSNENTLALLQKKSSFYLTEDNLVVIRDAFYMNDMYFPLSTI